MSATPLFADLDGQLTNLSFFSDPYSVYRRLRQNSPVHWCEPWGQWVITRYEDVKDVSKNPACFSSAGWEKKFMSLLPPQTGELVELRRHYDTRVVSNTDPPEHTRLRRLVVRSFTPRVLEAMRPRVEKIVDELLDKLERSPEVDAISQFAFPLPAIVIAELLGAPQEARKRFMEWSLNIINFVGTGQPDPDRAQRADQTVREFRQFLEPLINERRCNPTGDLLSLLASSDGDDQLTMDELVSTCIILLFAGHETTANLIGNGLLALFRHPEQLQRLREHPDMAPGAVEELVRYDSPVQRNRRVATEDVEMHGKLIRRGDSVLVFTGSANRDEEVFERPDDLDIGRSPNHHQAFGHGIHFCVGAGLSRLEAPIAVTRFLERFPDVRLSPHFRARWRPNITFRGLESLEVKLR